MGHLMQISSCPHIAEMLKYDESYFSKRKWVLFPKKKMKVMTSQVAEIHTEATHIHIGCDEVSTFV